MREAALKTVEYEFTLPDGTKQYAFVDPDPDCGYTVMRQIEMFKEMFGAVSAQPVSDNNSAP